MEMSMFATQLHTRVNAGSTADLNVLLSSTPGWLLGLQAFNVSTGVTAHLHLYDVGASSVGASSISTASVPFWSAPIPSAVGPSTQAVIGGWVNNPSFPLQLNFGLGYAVSASIQSSALSSIAAGLVRVNLQYSVSSGK